MRKLKGTLFDRLKKSVLLKCITLTVLTSDLSIPDCIVLHTITSFALDMWDVSFRTLTVLGKCFDTDIVYRSCSIHHSTQRMGKDQSDHFLF